MNKLFSKTLSLFLIATSLIITSCDSKKSSERVTTTSTPSDTLKKVTVIDNVPYRIGSKAWTLDMAMPEKFYEGKPRPAIVIIHGGGWRAGSKEVAVYRRLLINYAFQGYVTISVEYRLVDEAPFPACIEDVKCAVRWLRAHAKDYNVDPELIGVYGHSAGAHLALMLAMAGPTAGLEGDGGYNEFPSNVTCAIGGATPTQDPANQPQWDKKEWWPVGYISKDVAPILMLHGTEDEAVDVKTADDFVDKMRKAGANIEYVKVEGGRHGVAYMDNLDVTDPAMNNFFAKYLKK